MDLSIIPADVREEALEIIKRCIVDRVFFAEEVLGVELEDWQRDLFSDMDAGHTLLSIRSGVGVGKTTAVSILAIHFLLFRDDVKVIATSPSFNQLTDGIIPEVNKWINRLPWWLKAQLNPTSERVTRLPDPDNNFISFRTARKENPETLQGIHATHVLLLVDEASGVHETVYDAGSGTMSTVGSITVLISNPTRVNGLFFKTHTKLKHLWRTYKITGFMSRRVDKKFIDHMAATYGVDSQQYKIRVLAEFPTGNADSIIPRGWVEDAINREVFVSPRLGKVWGVDVGRGGDPSAVCEVLGKIYVNDLVQLSNENVMLTVGYIKRKWDELDEADRPESIFVDVIGLGAGVADRLEELGLPVVAVNVAELASVSDRYVRLRAELWHLGRQFFERKNCGINPGIDSVILDKFLDELSETAFKDHSSGKLDVESKRDLKSRGLSSPNLADAFLMTLSGEGAVTNGVIQDTSWGKPLKYSLKGVY